MTIFQLEKSSLYPVWFYWEVSLYSLIGAHVSNITYPLVMLFIERFQSTYNSIGTHQNNLWRATAHTIARSIYVLDTSRCVCWKRVSGKTSPDSLQASYYTVCPNGGHAKLIIIETNMQVWDKPFLPSILLHENFLTKNWVNFSRSMNIKKKKDLKWTLTLVLKTVLGKIDIPFVDVLHWDSLV